jgi:hypothetical protein
VLDAVEAMDLSSFFAAYRAAATAAQRTTRR